MPIIDLAEPDSDVNDDADVYAPLMDQVGAVCPKN